MHILNLVPGITFLSIGKENSDQNHQNTVDPSRPKSPSFASFKIEKPFKVAKPFCEDVRQYGPMAYVLCKNEFRIPFKRGISHRFDTPLAILQVEVDRDDYSTKLIMVRVWDEEKPWSPFYLGYNGNFWVRGQLWESYKSSDF